MQTTILCLSDKQQLQLVKLSEKTQSFISSDSVTFIELLHLSINSSYEPYLKNEIRKFKEKYYPKGYRENNKLLHSRQIQIISKYNKPRFNSFYLPYKDIEKTSFLRAARACRDYLFSTMNEDDTNKLVQRIIALHRQVHN
jgi:hypothetical protein